MYVISLGSGQSLTVGNVPTGTTTPFAPAAGSIYTQPGSFYDSQPSASLPAAPPPSVGNQVTYTGVSAGLVVVLSQQQYYSLPRAVDLTTGAANYTDLSVPSQSVMDIAIPATAGVIVAGRARYLGVSVQSTGAATFLIQDSAGSYNGTTYSAQTIEEVDLTAAGDFENFYPYTVDINNSVDGGIVLQGNLTVASITGTYTGIVRIATR